MVCQLIDCVRISTKQVGLSGAVESVTYSAGCPLKGQIERRTRIGVPSTSAWTAAAWCTERADTTVGMGASCKAASGIYMAGTVHMIWPSFSSCGCFP